MSRNDDDPQPVDGPVETPSLRDAVGDVPTRPADVKGVRGALERLLDPDRAAERVQASRRRGVGALLPPLNDTGAEMLGEVPDGYQPGGYIGESPADRLRRLLAREEARERVTAYLVERDGFYDDPAEAMADDLIDLATGDADSAPLYYSDLRLLVGVEPPGFDDTPGRES